MVEKTREFDQTERRNSQLEGEVKSLRVRVEQLKKETIEALEQNDTLNAELKKVSRDLEEKTEIEADLQRELSRVQRKLEQAQRVTEEDE